MFYFAAVYAYQLYILGYLGRGIDPMCNPVFALTVTQVYTYMYMYFTPYDNNNKNLDTSNHNFGLKLIPYTQNIGTQKIDEKSNLHTGK